MKRQLLTVDGFVSQLHIIYGERLAAVLLYGSAATDESIAGVSDVNLLVLVSDVPTESLAMSAQTVRAWMEAGNPPPLVMTVAEWRQSADIFPMEYADILERHQLLHGAVSLDNISVRAGDLRLQLEREAMSQLLRLRRGVMVAGNDSDRQRDLMRFGFSALMAVIRAAARLAPATPVSSRSALIRQVALQGGFSPEPFERVAELVAGANITDSDTTLLLSDYVDAIGALVKHLDGLSPS